MAGKVSLGYAVGSGAEVSVPVGHMVVTGVTQQSGKTTTLDALVQRSGRKAVTFVTKRGETAFAGGHRMAPFFRERADWVFVASLIDATLGEKNKLLRSWLMKACRGTKTLAEVQRNVRAAKATARGFNESIYTEIDGYLDLVVPQLAQLPPVRKVSVRPGLNVVDVSPYSTELQSLVIKSVLEHVYEHETDTLVVIPEAWEFIPEGRGSPVKREAEVLLRKGASLGNFVWVDSQDLAGVWKLALRAASVYLVGVQREANEIKRTLANIPAGIAKPTAAEIAHLERGEFFACWGRHVVKTYVQPAWMTADLARALATGSVNCTADDIAAQRDGAIARARSELDELAREGLERGREAEADALDDAEDTSEVGLRALADSIDQEEDDDVTPEQDRKLDRIIELLSDTEEPERAVSDPRVAAPVDEEALYERFRARLLKDPKVLAVAVAVPRVEVETKVERITLDGKTANGRVALLLREGFFDSQRGAPEATNEINRRGGNFERITVYKALEEMCERGFLYRESLGNRSVVYTAVAGMKGNVVEKRAAG